MMVTNVTVIGGVLVLGALDRQRPSWNSSDRPGTSVLAWERTPR
ncbi:hypothetical protein [Schaalia sp. ZJ405]|nr:hypothetical protein [Schaalia sp. ZJ405]